ncbi:tRNA (adenosine(37)-N6)-threonylcarbamoyltransferase complex transferase subunit TsaD [uncultured Anaerofustis sp.]|uniref:tRNA (adenosine(37)-N6)-threonylcarbamoyltransferase complex transferase subunit TsaD n=1 Tax=uncultured Anaerofustis sp. TaxID=904996 RepID=UPI0025EA52BF|nr:tRNA (adenosine(37)-N6)-threonylcarbamoyltransferase complex transferase subunit TsaD [uncultured Anaerofustis sp.]
MSKIITLAIETSCDETSASVVEDGVKVKSNAIHTQIDIHKVYGGVVPEIASRNHLMKISSVVDKALLDAGVTFDDIDFISVTTGPGLVGALLIGLSYAKALAFSLNKDLVGVNHMAGHISASFIMGAKPPFICLTASGGHTNITKVNDYTDFELLGSTKDDAAGEAFDKVARSLGLSYPGGVQIDKHAKLGDEYSIDFPVVLMGKDNLDFSFSGLKSAVLNYLNSKKMKNEEVSIDNVCASFNRCVVDTIVTKTMLALKKENMTTLCVGGGVLCNDLLRNELKKKCEEKNIKLFLPDKIYCTDNAAMIGSAGYFNYINNKKDSLILNANPDLKL